MINQQLLDYVRQQLAAGVAKEEITKTLLTQGWPQQDINETFIGLSGANVSAKPAVASTVSSSQQTQINPHTFPRGILEGVGINSSQRPKKRRRILKFFLWTTGLLLSLTILILLVPSTRGLFYKDVAPVQNQKKNTVSVTKGVIIEEITFNGTVKPSQEVKLSFERTGMVRTLPLRVGGKTRIGDLMAALDKADIITQIARAEADMSFEEAKLEELKRGPRPEELRVADVKVENAKKSLEDSLSNVFSSLLDAFTKSDDAIRNKLDQIIDNPQGSNPRIKSDLATSNSSLRQTIESNRLLAEGELTDWNKSLALLTTTDALGLKEKLDETKQHLLFIRSLLGDAAFLLSVATPNINISQQTIGGYRSSVVIGRINR